MTLTEAAFWTKRFGVIVLIAVAIFIIILFFIFSSKASVLPPEYLTSNFACTETRDEFLENELSIPSLDVRPDSEMIYELQTNTGKVDTLPRIVNVYRYANLGQSLTSQGDAKILAKKMGFDPDKIVRKGTTDYIWVDSANKRSLDIKAKDLNFILKTTDPNHIRNIRKEFDLPSEKEAQSIATNTLRSLGVLEEAYTQAPLTTHLIDINPDGTFSQAASLLDAELIRVDFFRKIPMITIPANIQDAKQMVDSLTAKNLSYDTDSKIVNDERIDVYSFSTLVTYQNPVKSNISVYVGPDTNDSTALKQIYQIEFNTWSVEEDSCGTYELLAPSYALERIQNGEGSLVYLNADNDEVSEYIPQTIKKLVVSDIYITYYEGLNEQKFLQPVYMVEGQAELKDGTRADFHIYYPAVNYKVVQDRIELEPAPVEEKSGFGLL